MLFFLFIIRIIGPLPIKLILTIGFFLKESIFVVQDLHWLIFALSPQVKHLFPLWLQWLRFLVLPLHF